jgi:hypothetical protein
MVRHWMLLCLVTVAAVQGCSWLVGDHSSVPIFRETPFVSAKQKDTEIIAGLYDYAERLRDLDETGLRQEYQSLVEEEEALPDCKEHQTCLKLAWLLSGVDSSLADYDKARVLLDKTLANSSGSLLKGYIYEWRHIVEHNKMLNEQLTAMRYKMLTERREGKLLREKIETLNTEIKTLEMKIEALTSIEQSLKNREQRQ